MFRTTKYGRLSFLLEEDNGLSQGGNGQDNQQQTQQTQQTEIVDPFKGFDSDMLSDEQREIFKGIQEKYKDAEGRAKQALTYQSELDRTKAELARHQQTLHSMQSSQNQQQQSQNPTLEDELFKVYKEDYRLPDEQARQFAKIEIKKQALILGQFEKQQAQNLAPVINQVVSSNANDAFIQAMQEDRVGYSQNHDIQQRVWEQIQQLSQGGQLVNKQVVQNLARIFYVEAIENGTLQLGATNQMNLGNNQQQQPSQFKSPPQGMPSGRFSFPTIASNNNGNYSRQPLKQEILNSPEITAAMGATVSSWPVKPKGYKDVSSSQKTHITRNGQ